MILTVQEYDAAEQEAKCGLSFTELMAFSPQTFKNLGFPHRVRDERELVRYADWNRDAENQEYFKPAHFMGGPGVWTDYTLDEVAAMDRVRDQAVEVTRKLGRTVRPLCGPFAQLGLFRILCAMTKNNLASLRVFEVGPGTGYLGALLVNNGAEFYSFTDNAQALFLWQSRMLAEVGRSEVGIPWWQLARGKNLPPVDVVISNANLAEMTPSALKIVAHHIRNMLGGSAIGLLLFTNFGAQSQNTNEGVHNLLEHSGFRCVFDQLFRGYVIGGHQLPFDTDPLQVEIPLYNPSGRPERISGKDAVLIPDDQRPLDLDITKILEGREPHEN